MALFRLVVMLVVSLGMTLGMAAESDAPVGAASAKVDGGKEPDQRALARERHLQAAREAMLHSSDALALLLTAKYARTVDTKPDETRSTEEQNERQIAVLTRALEGVENNERKRSLVEFQVALFCMGLSESSLCKGDDRVLKFAESHRDNVVGWVMVAGREFAQGRNPSAQIYLAKAAKAKSVDWYYRDAAKAAFEYAKAAAPKDVPVGDVEVVAFTLLEELTLPAYQRFSQMCNPDPEGKLPEGRYAACKKVAQMLQEKAETNIEVMVGYRAAQRLAEGEKKAVVAEQAGNTFKAWQAATSYLWGSALSYPPKTEKDAQGLSDYFAALVAKGEKQATLAALKRAGKTIEDFKPTSAANPKK
ncbi:MAG: hypothetical protein JNM52_03995 [Betaproteobacteria bacterium]|nr:hypothetical protein [Betaproteobacteria bacterium]